MKYMKRRGLKLFAVAALLPMISSAAPAQSHAAAASAQGAITIAAKDAGVTEELTRRVRDFLANVPKGDRAIFDEFFGDDVIYTRSAGVTVDKAEILKNIGARAATEPGPARHRDRGRRRACHGTHASLRQGDPGARRR